MKSRTPFLLLGILGYLLLCFDIIIGFYPTLSLEIGLNMFWMGTCLYLLYAGHLIFIDSYVTRKEIFNVEQLLFYILFTGVVTFVITSMSDLFSFMGADLIPTPVESVIFYLVAYYLLVAYLITTLILFKKLAFVNKNAVAIISWRMIMVLLLIAPIFNYLNLEVSDAVLYSFYGLGVVATIPFLFRYNWLLLLNLRSKIISILLLSLSNIVILKISFDLTEPIFFENASTLQYSFFNHLQGSRNVFLLLLTGIVNGYGLFSLAAIIFNLPVTAELRRKESEVSGFQEISKIIQEKLDVEEILSVILEPCIQNTRAQAGWVWLKENNGKKAGIISLKGINVTQINEINSTINNQYSLPPTGQDHKYISHLYNEEPFRKIDIPFRSMVIFYVVVEGKVVGRLVLLKKYRSGFDSYMLKLVSSYIEQAGIVIENSNLLSQRLEGERVKEELAVARRVQQDLLPASFPKMNGLDIAASSESANEVGGDYFDFFKIDESKIAIIIADVSGKGTSAAFHMAELKGIFHAMAPMGLDTMDFVIRMNTAVNNCLESNLFITVTYLVVDTEKQEIEYLRAGHCPVLVFTPSNQKASYLEDKGIGLGIVANNDLFESLMNIERIKMVENGVLVLFTDGILEARAGGDGEEFGYDRLSRTLEEVAAHEATGIRDGLFARMNEFTGMTGLIDDSTIVVLKFTNS